MAVSTSRVVPATIVTGEGIGDTAKTQIPKASNINPKLAAPIKAIRSLSRISIIIHDVELIASEHNLAALLVAILLEQDATCMTE